MKGDTMMKHWILGLALGAGLAASAWAEPLTLTLQDSEQAAVDASQSLKAARLQAQGAKRQQDAAWAALMPRLGLDGSYRYIANVPEVQLGPQALQAGTFNNFSVGVSAQWDVFSLPAIWRQYQGSQDQAKALDAQAAQAERELRLQVRLAYFQTRLAATQQHLYADALKLAQSQADDLDLRLKAGSSSRIDDLEASDDELDDRSTYRLSQADLADTLRRLFALTGQHKDADLSLPVVESVGQSLPAKVAQPSLVVSLDPAAGLLADLAGHENAPFNPGNLPQVQSMQALVEAAQRQAQALWAGHLPSGTLGYRLSRDYPDLFFPELVTQQTTSANVSLQLFAFGGIQAKADAQQANADAQGQLLGSATTDLERDYHIARDRLEALKDQRDLQTLAAKQAAQLRDLVYQSYKVGGSTFLEVQSSSLKSLQANLALAITETQMLIELADLAALTDSTR
jgi:outer membrane protein TolC